MRLLLALLTALVLASCACAGSLCPACVPTLTTHLAGYDSFVSGETSDNGESFMIQEAYYHWNFRYLASVVVYPENVLFYTFSLTNTGNDRDIAADLHIAAPLAGSRYYRTQHTLTVSVFAAEPGGGTGGADPGMLLHSNLDGVFNGHFGDPCAGPFCTYGPTSFLTPEVSGTEYLSLLFWAGPGSHVSVNGRVDFYQLPEPGTFLTLGLGLAALALHGRRRLSKLTRA